MSPQLHVSERWLDQAIRLIAARGKPVRVPPTILAGLTDVSRVGPIPMVLADRTPVRAVRSVLDVPVG